jgi:hypothetical protein
MSKEAREAGAFISSQRVVRSLRSRTTTGCMPGSALHSCGSGTEADRLLCSRQTPMPSPPPRGTPSLLMATPLSALPRSPSGKPDLSVRNRLAIQPRLTCAGLQLSQLARLRRGPLPVAPAAERERR